MREAKKVGISDNKILLEKSFQYDVHVNASTFLGKIHLGEPLFRAHGSKPAEIMAILSHELGHYKLGHLNWSLVVDTVYMVIYGTIISFLINDSVFLRGFGFP